MVNAWTWKFLKRCWKQCHSQGSGKGGTSTFLGQNFSNRHKKWCKEFFVHSHIFFDHVTYPKISQRYCCANPTTSSCGLHQWLMTIFWMLVPVLRKFQLAFLLCWLLPRRYISRIFQLTNYRTRILIWNYISGIALVFCGIDLSK